MERLAAACLTENLDMPERTVRFDFVNMLVLADHRDLLRHHTSTLCTLE